MSPRRLAAESLAYVLSRALMRSVPHDSAAAHAASPSESRADTVSTPVASASDSKAASAAVVSLSQFADKGTRWEPSREEQESMSRIFVFWLTSASLI
jgi:hypothetical protein